MNALDGFRAASPESMRERFEKASCKAEREELGRRLEGFGAGHLHAPPRETRCAKCLSTGKVERRCLACGRLFCPNCQQGGGARCHFCGGPVWVEGEQRSAPIPNPVMKGY